MFSAFFVTWSVWFTFLFATWFGFGVARKSNTTIWDMFLAALIFSFLATIPSFYGVYKLLGGL